MNIIGIIGAMDEEVDILVDLMDIEKIVEKAFELMPEIAEVYKANGWEMGIFFLNKATAEIRNMMEIEESYEFEY